MTLLALQANMLAIKEPRAVFPQFGQGGPDIEVQDKGGEGCLLLDIQVTSVIAKSNLPEAGLVQGHAAKKAVARKNRQSKSMANEAGYGFVPMVFEAQGAMSHHVRKFVKASSQGSMEF